MEIIIKSNILSELYVLSWFATLIYSQKSACASEFTTESTALKKKYNSHE